MTDPKSKSPKSAFSELGFKQTIEFLKDDIKELYLCDQVPWVVGYSGGKDSTATLQLLWLAIRELPAEQRKKPVHVISTDTLVENPIVAAWVTKSLESMRGASLEQALPFQPHRLTPDVNDSFWVNLIGRGYPAPRHKFRWCTERMKIKPSNNFIRTVVQESGEAILVLGTRKAESSKRMHNMEKHARNRTRDRLSPNASLPNSLVYTPVEDWSNDDVWMFLMQVQNPWGYKNKDLLGMYASASADSECPLVVDTSTPSCGDSRFGCWVCTVVDEDKSMTAMIQNDAEKEWMLPLLEFRNALDIQDDRHLRDFRRMSGAVQLFHDRPIPGPYKQPVREEWLRRLLGAQTWLRKNGPIQVRGIELITMPELHEIRRIWVIDKHELEDSLLALYLGVTGEEFPGTRLDDHLPFGREEVKMLKELCNGDDLHFQMIRELLDVERRFRSRANRAGLFEALEESIRRSFFTDEADATTRARRQKEAKDLAEKGDYQQLSLLQQRER